MKKTALLLSLLMLFTLALSACTETDPGSSTPSTEPSSAVPTSEEPAGPAGLTEEDLKNSKPNEYVQEKLDAGMDVLIGCSMIADVPILMEVWAGQITDVIEPLGFSWVINHAGGDTGNMISQIENYVTMGAAAIVLVPPDKDSVRDAVLKAEQMGTYCVIYGITGVDYCYSVLKDIVLSSELMAHMGIEWAKMTFPDATAENPVKFAAIYNTNVEDAKLGGETVVNTINNDPVCEVVFKLDSAQGSIDSGFKAAEDALTYDSGIRVFVCTQALDALGVSNYVMSQPGLDYSKYASIGQNSDPGCLDAITNLAPNNEAIIRGSGENTEQNGTAIANCTVGGLFGEYPYPYEYKIPGYCVVQPGWDYAEEY